MLEDQNGTGLISALQKWQWYKSGAREAPHVECQQRFQTAACAQQDKQCGPAPNQLLSRHQAQS